MYSFLRLVSDSINIIILVSTKGVFKKKGGAAVCVVAWNSRCASCKTKWHCGAVNSSYGVEVAVCGRNLKCPKPNFAKHSFRYQTSTQELRCRSTGTYDPLFFCLRFRDLQFAAKSVVSSWERFFFSMPFHGKVFFILLSASTVLISGNDELQFLVRDGRKSLSIMSDPRKW